MTICFYFLLRMTRWLLSSFFTDLINLSDIFRLKNEIQLFFITSFKKSSKEYSMSGVNFFMYLFSLSGTDRCSSDQQYSNRHWRRVGTSSWSRWSVSATAAGKSRSSGWKWSTQKPGEDLLFSFSYVFFFSKMWTGVLQVFFFYLHRLGKLWIKFVYFKMKIYR